MKNNYLLFLFMFSLSFGNKIIHDAPEYIDRESSYLFQSYFEQRDTRVRNGYIYIINLLISHSTLSPL